MTARLKPGTLSQELQAVADFLAIPQKVREAIGRDELWDHVRHRVLMGERTRLIDGDFRRDVMAMRECQRRILSLEGDAKWDALPAVRELERKVDEELSR